MNVVAVWAGNRWDPNGDQNPYNSDKMASKYTPHLLQGGIAEIDLHPEAAGASNNPKTGPVGGLMLDFC